MSISESVWAQTGEERRGDRFADFRELFAEIAACYRPDELLFLCIGTDRSSGDAFGPLLGSRLKAAGFPNVVGTLEKLCDANNLEELVSSLPDGLTIVACDACLGKPGSVGKLLATRTALTPAGSMKGSFAPVGDYSIAAVVNSHGPKPYQALQTASLGLVLQLVEQTAEAAKRSFGMNPRIEISEA
ncbi:spore protease YyaC [Saccharibacillus endophyticus]|uniref:Spore protease YyaC n=1 Tax=Saccharibacillus endophyticus TaxID=2060666 RepID=A0ABQ2A9N8_9BACL|nr:spore protease YyaC [Saccharibacillus endophyticus]GGH87489.1 spore protease YyaC [Saccharibacillus endophyticus]